MQRIVAAMQRQESDAREIAGLLVELAAVADNAAGQRAGPIPGVAVGEDADAGAAIAAGQSAHEFGGRRAFQENQDRRWRWRLPGRWAWPMRRCGNAAAPPMPTASSPHIRCRLD